MRLIFLPIVFLLFYAALGNAQSILVEAESFNEKGGWVIDQQFTDQMGSSYLLAHGLGQPVDDAVTTVTFPSSGTYKMWVRTKNWIPGKWDAPGRFQVIFNGLPIPKTFGTMKDWTWQDGGIVNVTNTNVQIKLHDLTGFEGRCDAIYFDTETTAKPVNFDPANPQINRKWRNDLRGLPNTPPDGGQFDVVIVGGGISGCAAALAAEKQGLKVALIHDRQLLGGNASSEIRVHTEGIHGKGGEILSQIDTGHYPNGNSAAIYDQNKREVVMAAADITIFRSHRAYDVQMKGTKIVSVDACSVTSGKALRIRSNVFIDCTGDGWIGYWAGADYSYGRESKNEYNESWDKHGDLWSPKVADNRVMGCSLLWNSGFKSIKSTFPEVPWAMDVAKQHSATGGQWFWEYSDNDKNMISDAEDIRDHMFRAIYGSFYNAKQLTKNDFRKLDWMGYLSGKRESRRLIGDYIYKQSDATSGTEFDDAVVEETRVIDVHYQRKLVGDPHDFLSKGLFLRVPRYYIPFRCLYSRNIDNLMMAGRCFSCTHVGLGGPRVMNTCGQMGIATGYAASLCIKYQTNPRGVYKNYIRELRTLVGYETPLSGKTSNAFNMSKSLRPAPASAKFIDEDYYIWGASMVKDKQGTCHLFYSRWPREGGHYAWVTHSEIAHAVSDNPLGPYKHVDVALPERGAEYWDGLCTHNPNVHEFDGKYYIYYTGNTGDRKKTKKWNMSHRNNQRIGVAVADHPNGPWQRFDSPLIDVSPNAEAPDALGTNNPSICRGPDGGFLLVYKAIGKKRPLPMGGPVVHLAATSSSPTGPFAKHDGLIFSKPGDPFPAEDPFIWCQDGKYRAIVKDMKGAFTHAGPSLAAFESDDGLNWHASENPLVSKLQIQWEDRGIQKVQHLERPQIFCENGIPKVLFCAADMNRGHSFNVHIPLTSGEVQPLEKRNNIVDFTKLIPPILPRSIIYHQDGYLLWDPCIVQSDDGKYHLFYSRWLEKFGHRGWCTHAEIARATSDNAAGPYTFQSVVLPARGVDYWDGHSVYNTCVVEIDKKYYLYYTGNHGDDNWAFDRSSSNKEWWIHRNNQRIGVAVADSPGGPWKRLDKPLMDVGPGFGHTIINVPNLVVKPEGGYRLYYKTLAEGEGKLGGGVFHFGSDSESPLGPFVRHPEAIVNKNKLMPEVKKPFNFHIDDHFEWIQDGRYYAIVKDHDSPYLTEHGCSLILFESADGRSWLPSKQSLVKKFFINWDDGTTDKYDRLEMPKLLFEKGRPTVLSLAAKLKGSEESFIVNIPLSGRTKRGPVESAD
jgi:predicted GH43/DUF377 family glycosyl hydrolase